MTIKNLFGILIFISSTLLAMPSYAQQKKSSGDEKPSFEQYIADFKVEAMERGFNKDFLDESFKGIRFYKRAVKSDKNQPEFKQTLDTYLPQRLPNWKVNKAIELYKENKRILDDIGKNTVYSRVLLLRFGGWKAILAN